MKLLHPFGDSINDINIVGMGEAVIVGMEKDSKQVETVCQKEGEAIKRRKASKNAHTEDVVDDVYGVPGHDCSGPIGSGEEGADDYYAFP